MDSREPDLWLFQDRLVCWQSSAQRRQRKTWQWMRPPERVRIWRTEPPVSEDGLRKKGRQRDWEKSTREVDGKPRWSDVIKTRAFQGREISNFPLHTAILWSQLQLSWYWVLLRNWYNWNRTGKVQRSLAISASQISEIPHCLCKYKTKNNFVSLLVEVMGFVGFALKVEYFLSLHIPSIDFLKLLPAWKEHSLLSEISNLVINLL